MRPGSSDEVVNILTHLTEQVGGRRASSPEEAQAAAFVNARLRRAGMGVTTIPLQVALGRGWLLGPVACFAIAAALLTLWQPLLGLTLALAPLIVLLADSLIGPLAPLGARKASQSIVGTRSVEGGAGLAPRMPRWRVVVLAPLDTPLQLYGLAWLAGPARMAIGGRIAAVSLIVLAAGLALALGQPLWALLSLPAALYLVFLLAGIRDRPPARIPDGGTGALAALLLVAQRLVNLERVELWVAAIGGTSTDTAGLAHFLDLYPFDTTQTLVIALENIAHGQLIYASREGALIPRLADQLLVGLAVAADAADTLIDAEPRPRRIDGSLANLMRRHGYRALTLFSSPATPGDTVDIDPRLVERAARLVVEMVHQLEAQ